MLLKDYALVTAAFMGCIFATNTTFFEHVNLDVLFLVQIATTFVSRGEKATTNSAYYVLYALVMRFHKFVLVSLIFFGTPIRSMDVFISGVTLFAYVQVPIVAHPDATNFVRWVRKNQYLMALVQIGDLASNWPHAVLMHTKATSNAQVFAMFALLGVCSSTLNALDHFIRVGRYGMRAFLWPVARSVIMWEVLALVVVFFRDYAQAFDFLPMQERASQIRLTAVTYFALAATGIFSQWSNADIPMQSVKPVKAVAAAAAAAAAVAAKHKKLQQNDTSDTNSDAPSNKKMQ